MAHTETDPQPDPGVNFGKQQGVGQGTIGKRRRRPRKEVNDVSISEASGLSLGEDGLPHPLETDPEGNLKIRVRDITSLLEEMVNLQRATLFAISESNEDLGLDFDDLVEMFC